MARFIVGLVLAATLAGLWAGAADDPPGRVGP